MAAGKGRGKGARGKKRARAEEAEAEAEAAPAAAAAAAAAAAQGEGKRKAKAKAKAKAGAKAARAPADEGAFVNREKVLVLSSRGITYRYRHLMDDLYTLLPHSKREAKLDDKNDRAVLNEVAELKGCSSVIFFEVRKRRDLYLWLAKTPMGPSVKFLAANVHTMGELKLTGNHLKGSRPLLSFDAQFEQLPHLQLCKELLAQLFGTPKTCRRGMAFVDHVLSFTWLDGRIWVRNYQIADEKGNPAGARADATALDALNLVEVGPRFCLLPIRAFAGAFRGATLYQNEKYLSPAQQRAAERAEKQQDFERKLKRKSKRKTHEERFAPSVGEFDDLFAGGDE